MKVLVEASWEDITAAVTALAKEFPAMEPIVGMLGKFKFEGKMLEGTLDVVGLPIKTTIKLGATEEGWLKFRVAGAKVFGIGGLFDQGGRAAKIVEKLLKTHAKNLPILKNLKVTRKGRSIFLCLPGVEMKTAKIENKVMVLETLFYGSTS